MRQLIISALALTMVFEVSAMASSKQMVSQKHLNAKSVQSTTSPTTARMFDKKAKLNMPVKKVSEKEKAKI